MRLLRLANSEFASRPWLCSLRADPFVLPGTPGQPCSCSVSCDRGLDASSGTLGAKAGPSPVCDIVQARTDGFCCGLRHYLVVFSVLHILRLLNMRPHLTESPTAVLFPNTPAQHRRKPQAVCLSGREKVKRPRRNHKCTGCHTRTYAHTCTIGMRTARGKHTQIQQTNKQKASKQTNKHNKDLQSYTTQAQN